jgi:hypothetical protein
VPRDRPTKLFIALAGFFVCNALDRYLGPERAAELKARAAEG